MKKYLFIINPIAGNISPSILIPLIDEVSGKYDVEITLAITKHQKHATEIARGAVDYDFIISAGGDGTLNEVINGIDMDSGVILGLLPSGTGNDFKNNIKISKSIEENLNYYFSDNVKTVNSDIGSINYKIDGDSGQTHKFRFLNSLGIGFDAYAAYLSQKNKMFNGLTSYIIAVLKALIKYDSINVNFRFEDQTITGNKLLIAVGNGKTTGGGFHLTKDAIIDDGLLDVCVVDFVTRSRLLTKIPAAISKRIDQVPEVSILKLSSAKIILSKPYYVHADGELISDKVTELEISLEKNKLKIITF